jgi:hypothetical protein
MNNLSAPSSTDISSQIGALELGDHLTSPGDDGALETAGVTANGGPTTTGYCPQTLRRSCLLQ